MCDCGNIKNINKYHLIYGMTKSCGCLVNKHGESYTKLYDVFSAMKQRCYNKNNKSYVNYGKRGIAVCDEWLHDNSLFFEWAMNNGYKEGLQIDRIDVNGNYEPSNCRWVDNKVNCNNRRNNVLLTYQGKTRTMKQWAEELGVNYCTIKARHKRGWSDKDCLFGKGVK